MSADDLRIAFQVLAMTASPVILAERIAHCLARGASPFSCQALAAYFRAQRGLDVIWLVAAAALLSTAMHNAAWSLGLGAIIVQVAALQWYQHADARAHLGPANPQGDADAAPVDSRDCFVSRMREPGQEPTTPGAGITRVASRALLALHAGLLAWLLWRAGSAVAGSTLLLLFGMWLALRIVLVDLTLDVYPGATSRARLRGAMMYYTHVFEISVNHGVLTGLAIAMLGGPAAWLTGVASWPAALFGGWMLCGMFSAGLWNGVLLPAGRVSTRLPVPMGRNTYYASAPAWAWFVTALHLGMVPCLLAGIVSLQ